MTKEQLFDKFEKDTRYYKFRGQYRPAYVIDGLMSDNTAQLLEKYCKVNEDKITQKEEDPNE